MSYQCPICKSKKKLKINLKPENDSNYLNNSNILFCENCFFIFKDVVITNNKFYADKKKFTMKNIKILN